nr:SDR family NAD(P)-dependent oxidoreductase [uncultured Moellerella sp.]
MSSEFKTALITGASSGIGLTYAQALAAKGYNLLLVARNQPALEQLKQQLEEEYKIAVSIFIADLAQSKGIEEIEQVIHSAPQLELVINCAGVGALGSIESRTTSEINTLININVLALTRLSIAAGAHFLRLARGCIINISSIVGLMAAPNAAAYAASKAFVLSFSQALHRELQPKNVFVQAVLPGPVNTPFFGDVPPPFPPALFVSPQYVVEKSLTAWQQGESICFPGLAADNATLSSLKMAHQQLIQQLLTPVQQ